MTFAIPWVIDFEWSWPTPLQRVFQNPHVACENLCSVMMRNATSLRRADACERCIFTPSEAVDKSFQVCQIWGTTPNCRERERKKKGCRLYIYIYIMLYYVYNIYIYSILLLGQHCALKDCRSRHWAMPFCSPRPRFFFRQLPGFIFPPGFPIKLGRRQQTRCPPQQRETRRRVLQESVANSVGCPGIGKGLMCLGYGMVT